MRAAMASLLGVATLSILAALLVGDGLMRVHREQVDVAKAVVEEEKMGGPVRKAGECVVA